MPSAITELIIAASVDPTGVSRGLANAAGYLTDFGKVAEQRLLQSYSKFGADSFEAGNTAGHNIVKGLTERLGEVKLDLFERLARGELSPEKYARLGLEAGGAYNRSLLASMDRLKFKDILSPSMQNEFMSAFDMAGHRAGLAFEQARKQEMIRGEQELTALMARSAAERAALMRVGMAGNVAGSFGAIGISTAPIEAATGAASRLTNQLGRVGIGAAFAAEQLMQGGDKGEGAMRRVLRAVGVLGLAIGSSEGLMVSAAALGLAALMDYLHKAEKEAKKAADEIAKHIANAANAGKFDDLRGQARQVSYGMPYKPGATDPTKESAYVKGAFEGSLLDLRAHVASIVAKTYDSKISFAQLTEAREQLSKLQPLLTTQEDLLKKIGTAARVLRSQEAGNAGLANPYEVTATSPNAKGPKDHGPYADLRAQLGELTTAYEQMTRDGLRPSVELQGQLEDAFQRTGRMLAQLTDQTGPAANALRAIQQDMINAGIHARDSALAGGTGPSFTLTGGKEDKVAEAAIARVKELRESSGEFASETVAAESALGHLLDAINSKIEAQGGLLRANAALLKARGDIAKEQSADSKGQSKELWTLQDSEGITLTIERVTKLMQGIKETNDQWGAMREAITGVTDAASALGSIPQALSQVTRSLVHAVDIAKELKALRAPEQRDNKGNVTKEAGSGLSSLAGLAVGIGAIGAGISAVSGVIGLLSQHDATLEANNKRLAELRQAMVAPTGLAGQQTALDTLSAWASQRQAAMSATGLSGSPFSGSSGNGNQGLDAALAKAGISVEQFNKIAKDMGIEAGSGLTWLDAFQKALQLSVAAAHKFSDSLSDQTALSALRQKVYGKETPLDNLTATVDLLTKFAPKLAAGFDGINTATEEGRAKFTSALQKLFEQLASGGIDPKDFGGLGGAKDLAGIISTLMDSLTALGKSASTTAASLLNVPAGYKVALARFNAIDPQGVPLPVKKPQIGISDVGGGGDHNAANTNRKPGDSGVIINGDIHIDAKQMSSEDLFKSVLKTAQRKAVLQFGRSTDWAKVQT